MLRWRVVKAGLGYVTIALSYEECQAYITGAEANGGVGYSVECVGVIL